MDTATGVISHVQADLADGRDSAHLPALVQGLRARFTANELTLRDPVADTGYSTGFNYAFLEQRSVTPWIPAFGAYKPAVAGFAYDPAQDTYRCPTGKRLRFRACRVTEDGNRSKLYRATCQDCQQCPLRPTCVPGAQYKQLTRSAFDAAYRRAWYRQRTVRQRTVRQRTVRQRTVRQRTVRQRTVRQRTVEPVFSHLLHHYGLRRVGTKGRAAAHKAMLLSAVAYNLKKLLKHQPKQVVSVSLALQPDLTRAANRLLNDWLLASYPHSGSSLNYPTAQAAFCNSHEGWEYVTEGLGQPVQLRAKRVDLFHRR
ncbi:MAG: transposase [Janthinobacterium lividum]